MLSKNNTRPKKKKEINFPFLRGQNRFIHKSKYRGTIAMQTYMCLLPTRVSTHNLSKIKSIQGGRLSNPITADI